MRGTSLWLAAGALLTLAAVVPAQGRGDSVRSGSRLEAPRGRGRVAGRQGLRNGTPAERQALERRVRQAFTGVVRRQLNLDDKQMRQLQEADTKYERQRRALNGEERRARLALKASMLDSTRDQNRIAENIDQLLSAQRRRAELLEAEQKELSNFLTPMQRAQYLSLRERMARRLADDPRRDEAPPATTPPMTPPER
jgi:hypothetical protein